jgi:hypothetical protein
MKRIDLKQARSWCGMLLAGWLLAGLAPAAQSALFIDGFDPTHWTATKSGDLNSHYYFTGNNELTLVASPYGESDIILSLNSPYSSKAATWNVNWTLTSPGGLGEPLGYIFIGATEYDLTGNSGNLILNIPASTMIAFELSANSEKAIGATFDITEVPEAGNALAGLLVSGAAGFECFRRKRTAGG